ncbi:MAG: hypothetical protein R3F14_07375 [Polyangiaceae bacterium]
MRHAVNAYIDGRLLPTFEGDAVFETRNSAYRLIDGVLFTAPDDAQIGAELVGWLIDYVSRSEVTSTWRPGARAVLVDTRNDGVRGPHIVVTSATRNFRCDRPPPPVRSPIPPPPALPSPGSMHPQGGSMMDHGWPLSAHDVPAPLPVVAPPPARPETLPPPPPVPSFAHGIARPATLPPPPAPRRLPQALPPPPPMFHAASSGAYVRESASHRSRAHQRGMPLR